MMRTQFLKSQKKNIRRGFTLIEIITAVGIFAILTAIAVPSVAGYMESSEMMELNQTAKTLFLSAQDYLTQAAASGKLEEINESAAKVDLSLIVPALAADSKEMKSNKDNIYCLTLAKSGSHTGPLREVLDPFVGDKSILDQSILVEYNQNTGVVRSVFYSKRAGELNYSGNVTDRTDVKSRQDADLRQKRQGYYGVDFTGELGKRERLPDPEVKLVNGERLTVEWTDVTPSGALDMTYTLTIKSADLKTDYLRIEGIPNVFKSGLPSTMKASEATTQTCTISYPGAAVTTPISVSKSADGKKVVVILDDIHNSIYEKFPSIPVGEIRATVEPVVSWILSTKGISENQTNSYFGDGTTTGDSPVYEIAYARHLDNIRHAPETSNFMQTATINWALPEDGVKANPEILFETINFCYREGATEKKESAYKGTYEGKTKDGKRPSIDNLKFADGTKLNQSYLPLSYNYRQNYGLFHILDGATIKNLDLIEPTLNFDATYSKVGAFAGSANGATLNGCKADNSSSSKVAAGEHVGGLIGYAENTVLENVGNYTTVTGTQYVGGFVGEMTGDLSRIKNDTKNAKDRNGKFITGTAYVGGLVGKFAGSEILNGQNTFGVSGTGDNVGGLVGMLKKGTITNGIFKHNSKNVLGANNVGGLVGWNDAGGTINNPIISDDDIKTTDSKDTAYKNLLSGMKNGSLVNAAKSVYGSGNNVGGVVGQNDGTVKIDAIKANATAVKTNVAAQGDNAGGLIGNNTGTVTLLKLSTTDTRQHSDGVVASNGQYAGGIFGKNSNGTVKYEGLISGSHVAAKYYAGGIIGTNGAADSAGASISECTVKGMVYAMEEYAGGIAGANYGTISNCKSAVANASGLDGTISALKLTYGDYVGGIAGYNNGTIDKCTSGNLVKGKNFVGGITGKNDTNGSLVSCSTKGGRIIATENFAGGLIGLNVSTKQTFYDDKSMGGLNSEADLVQGKYYVGGVIGCNTTLSGALVIQSISGTIGSPDKCAVIGEAYVGGIIGYNGALSEDDQKNPSPFKEFDTVSSKPTNSTKLFTCKNYSSVSGVRYVGGMIGLNGADSTLVIESSQNDGTISYNESGTVKPDESDAWDNCYYIGGITGRNTAFGRIISCVNNGKISNRSKYTGGLVELNEGVIDDCTNSGEVASTQSHVGGIAGANISPDYVGDQIALIQNCIATTNSKVYGNSFVGGIVGDNNARIVDCTFASGSNGVVVASGDNQKGASNRFDGSFAGGIAGYNGEKGRIVSTDINADKDSTTKAASGTNKSSATRSLSGTIKGGYLVGGIVGYSEGGTAEKEDSTHNSSDDPNEISDLTNGATVYGQYFVGGIVGYHKANEIKNCINQKGGIVVSTGGVTGNGVGKTSVADNYEIKLDDTTVTLNLGNSGAGGIVPYNPDSVTISGCENRGTVYSGASATTAVESAQLTKSGGITALNQGVIKDCTNSGKVWSARNAYQYTSNDLVSDGDNAGGIAGINTGTVSDCIAKFDKEHSVSAQISGRKNVGGLVGVQKSGTLENFTLKDVNYTVSGGGYVGGLVGYWAAGTILLPNQIEVSANVEGKQIGEVDGKGWTLNQPRAIGGVIGFSDNLIQNLKFSGTVSGFQNSSNDKYQQLGGIVGKNTAGVSACVVTGTVNNKSNEIDSKNDRACGVGGIAGYSVNSISGCVVETGAKVTGADHVGGIVGFNAQKGTIDSSCKNEGAEVETRSETAGGFIGYNTSTDALQRLETTKLVNLAKVTGYEKVGGIVGESTGSIAWCENQGTVVCKRESGGGIAGSVTQQTDKINILNCTNKSNAANSNKIIGTDNAKYIGGILGSNSASGEAAVLIQDCVNEGVIEAAEHSACIGIGGIAGTLAKKQGEAPEVVNCENKGSLNYLGTGYIYNEKTPSNRQLSMGGIVGLMNGATVKSSINSGTIAVADTAERKVERVGGIVGEAAGSFPNKLEACKNQKTISFNQAVSINQLGGLIGHANGSNFEIIDSNNNAAITASSGEDVGGLVGYLTAGEVKISASNNNEAISSKVVAGGIVGKVYRFSGSRINTPVIENCKNNGEVTANVAGGILGLRDSHEVTVQIKSCSNTVKIHGIGTWNKNQGAVGGIVGSFGFNNMSSINGTSEIIECTNSGEIVCDNADGFAMGGIVGSASDNLRYGKVNVINSKNQAAIGENGIGRVGDIVGDGSSKGLNVINCDNDALVSAPSAGEVGGIVGRNGGTVISSSNHSAVTGHSAVGGIAGKNINEYAIIYTDTTKGADTKYCSNTGNVTAGGGHAGGIVGENIGGGVAGTYNTGDVSGVYAGGLIGLATKSGGTPSTNIVGTLVNSYSLAKSVSGTASTGGVIGFRQVAYDSIGSHSIKYGMYHNYSALALAVGNEPNAATGDALKNIVNDEPYDIANSGNSFDRALIEADFVSFKLMVPGEAIDWSDTDRLIALLEKRIQLQPYKPPQPRNTKTVSDQGYSYTTTWEMVQGVVTDYKVYLRAKDATDEKKDIYIGNANQGTPDPSGRLDTELSFDIKKIYEANPDAFAEQGIKSFQELIGIKYDIVVVTIGAEIPDVESPDKKYNLESYHNLSELDRKFLPPLPPPALQAPIIGTDKIYTIKIAEDAYKNGKPLVTEYPNLYHFGKGIYEKVYAYGLATTSFKAEDRADRYQGKVSVPNIDPLNDSYQFTVDHNVKEEQKTLHKIRAQALSNDTVDGYANSEWGNIIEYYVKIKLPAPTGLTSIFTGDAIKAQYDLKWNNVDNNSGYELTISYNAKKADGTFGRIDEIITLGKGTANVITYKWDASNIVFSDDPQAIFHLKTLGDDSNPAINPDDQIYLTSDKSVEQKIILPIKLKTPVFGPMQSEFDETGATCTVNWSHEQKDLVKDYTMKVFRYKIGESSASKEAYPSATSNTYTLGAGDIQRKFDFKDENADFGYVYVYELTANGIPQQSLTSDTVETTYTLYERLPIPYSVTVDTISAKPDLVVTWPEKQKTGEVYPQPYGAFELEFRSNKDLSAPPVIVSFQPGGGAQTYKISGEDGLGLKPGEQYQVSIKALGTADKSPSKKSDSITFTMMQQIPSVSDLKVEISKADDVLPFSEFGKEKHKVSWSAYSADNRSLMGPPYFTVKAFTGTAEAPVEITEEIKLYYTSAPAPTSDGFSQESTGFTFAAPALYAGKPIWFTVETIAGESALNSEVVESEKRTLPKAKLPTLQAEDPKYSVSTTTEATGNINIPQNDALAFTLAELEKQNRLDQYQMNFDIEYTAGNSGTTQTAKLSANIGLENFIVSKTEPTGVVVLSINTRGLELPTNLSRSERKKLQQEAENREEQVSSSEASTEEPASSESSAVESTSSEAISSAVENSETAPPPAETQTVQTAAAAPQTKVLLLNAHVEAPEITNPETESSTPIEQKPDAGSDNSSTSSEASSSSTPDSKDTSASSEVASSGASSENASASSEAASSSPESEPEPPSSPAERAHSNYEARRTSLFADAYDPEYPFNDDTTALLDSTSAFRPFRVKFVYADGDSTLLRIVSVSNLNICIKAKDGSGLVSSDGYGASGGKDAPVIDSGIYDSGDLDSGYVGTRSLARMEIERVPFEIIYEDGEEAMALSLDEESEEAAVADSEEEPAQASSYSAKTEKPAPDPEKPDVDLTKEPAENRPSLPSSSVESNPPGSRSVRGRNSVSSGKYDNIHQLPS